METSPIVFTLYQRAAEKNQRVFMFVSSNPGEGTTWCVRKIAGEMAEYFKNIGVAIVDLNISNPKLSDSIDKASPTLKVTYEPISGAKDLVETSPIYKNPGSNGSRVGLIPLARSVEHGELWHNRGDEFPSLLKMLNKQFDFILVDCAPILHNLEALFAARYMDGVFLIVEAGKTRRQVVKKALDSLKEANADIAGIILNKRSFYIPKWLYRKLF